MEPTLRDGDEVLVDSSDQGSRLRDGIYVLRADDALVVKRVTIQPGGRLITISSDNTAYPTWSDVDRSTIHVVGRVHWFGRSVCSELGSTSSKSLAMPGHEHWPRSK